MPGPVLGAEITQERTEKMQNLFLTELISGREDEHSFLKIHTEIKS